MEYYRLNFGCDNYQTEAMAIEAARKLQAKYSHDDNRVTVIRRVVLGEYRSEQVVWPTQSAIYTK